MYIKMYKYTNGIQIMAMYLVSEMIFQVHGLFLYLLDSITRRDKM